MRSLSIAYRLYLPREWADDKARRKEAHVPASIRYRGNRDHISENATCDSSHHHDQPQRSVLLHGPRRFSRLKVLTLLDICRKEIRTAETGQLKRLLQDRQQSRLAAALTTNGHAATLPSPAINSRRLMQSPSFKIGAVTKQ
jgi:hypothetical protein